MGTGFIRTAEFLRDPDLEVRGAMGLVPHEIAGSHTQELNTWLGTMHEWPDEWLRGSDLNNFKIRLIPELSLELA
ncbi:hypothetical protein ACWD9K_32815 [Streptomyces sp. 900116325]